jgi:ferritin-like metal-binding protein YciE
MKGLIKEAHYKIEEDAVKKAEFIADAYRVEHYEISP